MLGILRFFLASCVVIFHLSAHVPTIGILAVNFFYVISGYLITLILNETYHFGVASFFTNRFLRIYPAHFAVCLISLPLLWGLSGAHSFHPAWGGPQWQDWIGNILIFPWTFLPEQHLRIAPTTWSIGVELCCYFWLWLVVSRRPWTAALTIVIAVLWQMKLFRFGADPTMHYGPVSAAILPFSMGATAYFVTSRTPLDRPERTASLPMQLGILLTVITAFLLNWRLAVKLDPSAFYGTFYYLNSALACIAVIALHGLKVDGITKKIASWCGDLSYPVFLGQWIAGFLAWHLMETRAPMQGWAVFVLGYAIAIAIGIGCVVLIDRPIQKIRKKIRAGASRQGVPFEVGLGGADPTPPTTQ